MELRHLRYFIAVAEEEHFGRAARRLHVSQSPLSRQMQQLAEEMGIALFAPKGRGVRLTSAGRTFLDGARRALREADRAVEEARAVAHGQLGRLRIAFEGGMAFQSSLPDIFAGFRQRHPQVRLELNPLSSGQQREALERREIDVGYCYYPTRDRSVQVLELWRDRCVVVLPSGHPLTKERTLRVRDLAGVPFSFASRELDRDLYEELSRAFAARGTTLQLGREVTDPEALYTLVASGEDPTFGIQSMTGFLRDRLCVRRVSDLGVVLRGCAMWRAEAPEDPLVRSIVAETTKVFRGHRAG